jgi:DNA-binding response OmpR family regulator
MTLCHHLDVDDSVLWNIKPAPRDGAARLVIVLHHDDATGEMIASGLESEGFGAVSHTNLEQVELMLGYWQPGALLIDMRVAPHEVLPFIRAASTNPALAQTLLVALADPAAKGTTREARAMGFDGLCCGPCQVWRLAEMLDRRLVRRLHHAA